MINYDAKLRLQACVDGELPAAEVAEVQAWLARDPEARLLLAELKNTTNALKGYEADLKLPESRELFWSRIERQIQRSERPATPVPEGLAWWRVWLQGQFAPLAGVAVLAVMLGVLFLESGRGVTPESGEIDLASDDMGSHTFRDQEQKMTVVWLDDRADESESAAPVPLASVEPE
jgi:anti-sigma factor RsiW